MFQTRLQRAAVANSNVHWLHVGVFDDSFPTVN